MTMTCYQLIKMTEEGRRWKCIDNRIPERYHGECVMRHMIPRMIGGHVLERTGDLDLKHNVTLRLGGVGNEAFPQREFNSIDIEIVEDV